VITVVCLLFSTLEALVNSYEEIIALIPVLLLLSGRIGFGGVTALAMSVGAATVRAAFGPTNPFAADFNVHEHASSCICPFSGPRKILIFNGGGRGQRIANAALSQLSYCPTL
jgi:hypothetical protein